MKIKTNCTKCGKTIEVHCDKWLYDKYTDEQLAELRIDIVNWTMEKIKENNNECFHCYFMIK